MSRWLHEFWVVALLVALAFTAPLLMTGLSSARRLALRQEEHALCASMTRKLDRCMYLHPGAELAPDAYRLCRAGGSSHADCAEWNPRSKR